MPELFDALGIEPVDFLRTDGDFFLLRRRPGGHGPQARARLRPAARARATSAVYTSPRPATTDYDIVSRCFAPRVGIDEDPVTGSMHCVLVAYWGPRLGKDELHAYQASARGGELTVVRAGDRALLTGRAIDGATGRPHRL